MYISDTFGESRVGRCNSRASYMLAFSLENYQKRLELAQEMLKRLAMDDDDYEQNHLCDKYCRPLNKENGDEAETV